MEMYPAHGLAERQDTSCCFCDCGSSDYIAERIIGRWKHRIGYEGILTMEDAAFSPHSPMKLLGAAVTGISACPADCGRRAKGSMLCLELVCLLMACDGRQERSRALLYIEDPLCAMDCCAADCIRRGAVLQIERARLICPCSFEVSLCLYLYTAATKLESGSKCSPYGLRCCRLPPIYPRAAAPGQNARNTRFFRRSEKKTQKKLEDLNQMR